MNVTLRELCGFAHADLKFARFELHTSMSVTIFVVIKHISWIRIQQYLILVFHSLHP